MSKGKTINLDEILTELGDHGKFQLIFYVIMTIPIVITSFYMLSYLFTSSQLDYRCNIPECENSSMLDVSYMPDWIDNAVPMEHGVPAKCLRFASTKLLNQSKLGTNGFEYCDVNVFNRSETIRCNEFVYKTDEVNIVNEFSLQCEENEWRLTLIGSLGNIGEILTLPIFGLLSDIFGRRKIFLVAFAMSGTIGFLQGFSPNYLSFATAQFINAALSSGLYMTIYLLSIELAAPKTRGFVGAVIHLIFSLAQVLLGFTAMYVHNFRVLLKFYFGLTFLALSYIWLTPESVRWLLQRGEIGKARKILCKVAKVNEVVLSEKTLAILNESNNEEEKTEPKSENSYPLWQALKSKEILIRLATFCCCFFTINFIYYGLNVHSVALLGGNKYLNFTLLNLSEPPAVIVSYYLMQKMGRKLPLCGFMIFCSVAVIISEVIPDDYFYLRLFLLVLGKFDVTLAFTVLFMYASELFPTNLRQSCMNVCQTFGRCGGILAPQIPLLAHIFSTLPIISFGGSGILTGLLILTLPETLNTVLPDTVEEATSIGQYNSKL